MSDILIILILCFMVIAYVLTFIAAIIVGYNKGIGGLGLILVAILLTPFLALAYVYSVRELGEIVDVEYKDKEGRIQKINLKEWIKKSKANKVQNSQLNGISDLNQICWNCYESISQNTVNCPKCKKKAKRYALICMDNSGSQKILIPFNEWQNIILTNLNIIGIKQLTAHNRLYIPLPVCHF